MHTEQLLHQQSSQLPSSFIGEDKLVCSNTVGDSMKDIHWNSLENCIALKSAFEVNLSCLLALRRKYQDHNGDEKRAENFTQEIRIMENKLVRVFGRFLYGRKKFDKWDDTQDLHDYPLLSQWLLAVGLDEKCKEILCEQYEDINELLNAEDEELKILFQRRFNLKSTEDLQILNVYSSKNEENSTVNDSDSKNKKESLENEIRRYVQDYLKQLLKAQNCVLKCLEALNNGNDLPLDFFQYWDSCNHWIVRADSAKRTTILAAIVEATKKAKSFPKPLPPLPDLKSNFLKNYRINGQNNSRSTGSSPLSPPAPPLSAGFYNNMNIIIDPNHAPPFTRRPTPPPTPPVTHHKRSFIFSSTSIFSNSRSAERKFPTTPPPIRHHQANAFGHENFPLTKSKSHEEQLSNRIEPLDPVITNKLLKKYNLIPLTKKTKQNKHNSLDNLPHAPLHYRRRLATEPGSIGSTSPILSSSNCSSPIAISPENQTCSEKQSSGDNCFLESVPRSPRSTAMSHSIHHRFVSTMKINSIQCNVCEKQMFFGFKCRDCKYYCHRDCQDRAPNSCGLPNELVDVFKLTLSDGRSASPIFNNKGLPNRSKSQISNYSTQGNSHSSSNPSSPALFNHYSSSSSTTISPTNPKFSNSQFQFPPDISVTSTIIFDDSLTPELYSRINQDSINSDKDSISTIHEEEFSFQMSNPLESDNSFNTSETITSVSSEDSVKTIIDRVDSQDSTISDIDSNDRQWPRQSSVTAREWDIPYDELKVDEEIGTGRFGTVYRGRWHGNVAIKRLHMSNNVHENQKALDNFKQEVAIFRKTRHDNLVLFMGACMNPPHLAIVTSLCKGLTLHTHIHIRHDKFNLNRTIMIAEQICLGMGYLHARGIVHKDLKTKNIFYENGKIIITDFGLSSVAKLCVTDRRGDWLTVPRGWLCYLAPEIIRTLSVSSQESDDFPFSFSTDIYAFGTVWYELLFGCWPFTGQPPEVVIWQVGRGIKQPISNCQSSKEIKDIFYTCWAFNSEDRSDFSKLYDLLEKLPKKRLQRSPSHPAHLQHTSEQTFF